MAEYHAAPDDAELPAAEIVKWRRARLYAACLLLPLVLCLPALLLLRHDTGVRRDANVILVQRVGTIDAQIADLKALFPIKAQVLARKEIVRALDEQVPPAVDAVHLVGRLPAGVKLLAFEWRKNSISLAAQCATSADELALLDELSHSGYSDLRIASRRGAQDGAIDLLAISASLPRLVQHELAAAPGVAK